ncbi:MAG: hypothetical protein ABIB46_06610 [bacterium]
MAFITMENLEITSSQENKSFHQKTIMIFTEGTIMGPRHWWDWPFDKKYIQINNCVTKIMKWKQQSVKIVYLTSRTRMKDIEKIKENLLINGFPGTRLYFRGHKERYSRDGYSCRFGGR